MGKSDLLGPSTLNGRKKVSDSLIDDEYTVTFVADYFTMNVCVQGVEVADGEDPEDVAIDLAKNILSIHYGMDITQFTNDISVQ